MLNGTQVVEQSEVERLATALRTVTAERDALVDHARRRGETVDTLARELGRLALEQERTGKAATWLAESLTSFARQAAPRLSVADGDRLGGIRARADELAASLTPKENDGARLRRELAEAKAELARLRTSKGPAVAYDCIEDDDGEAA